MGLYDRAYYRDDEDGQGFFAGGGAAGTRPFFVTLLIINVVVFFADTLFLNKQLTGDGNVRGLFSATSTDLFNPLLWWRFLTAGFSHDPNDIMHLVGNMIGLFIFGRAIEQTYGRKKFLAFYLTAIVLGNVGFALRTSFLAPPVPQVIGASGGVTAIIILFALRHPRQTVLFMMMFPMPAWVLGIFIVVMDVMNSFTNTNIATDVHLIGAAYGFLFFKTGVCKLNSK